MAVITIACVTPVWSRSALVEVHLVEQVEVHDPHGRVGKPYDIEPKGDRLTGFESPRVQCFN